MTRYFKILMDGKSCNGGNATWSLPHDDQPGDWMPEINGIQMCERGYHVCAAQEILTWIKEGCQIFEAENAGESMDGDNKTVCSQVRLIRQMTWNDSVARLFAADCAEHVLRFYEEKYPNEKRPRQAIETARRFARGKATREELDAARDAAWDAAWDAARDAAWAADRDAARAAAWDAAWDAAWAAARAAAWDAAWDAARDAAWDAARAAAWDAAWAAAWAAARAAAWDAEKDWQTDRLLQYLDGQTDFNNVS